jgi:hypothetical protein
VQECGHKGPRAFRRAIVEVSMFAGRAKNFLLVMDGYQLIVVYKAGFRGDSVEKLSRKGLKPTCEKLVFYF